MKPHSCAIVGAGIAGVATAYWLSVRHGLNDIALIDRGLPLSFTTANSGENFRDCWPQPSMTALTTRSIELMDAMHAASGGAFEMRYSGYEFVSESIDASRFDWKVSNQGNGSGMERVTDRQLIRETRPYLSPDVEQVVRILRAGAFDVQALGSWLLKESRRAGVSVLRSEVSAIEQMPEGGFRLSMQSPDGDIACEKVVLAAGPFTGDLAEMLGIKLPLENVLQQKFVIPDPLKIIPRDMPFTIVADPQYLQWSETERELISDDPEFAGLLEEFPVGLHIKPESGDQIKLGWAFNRQVQKPRWNPASDERFPEIVMRGAQRFIPSLKPYVEDLPAPIYSFAGYYTRTPENLPLIGPLGLENAYVVSALAGFGTMAACAAAELCGAWVTESQRPEYSRIFSPMRYEDPQIMAEINKVQADGQL